MTNVTNCLECSREIPPDAQGLCPKCLLKLGLASQLSPGFTEGGGRPPPVAGFDPLDPAQRLAIEPFEFGGYRILRLLGKGGMGAVYEAEDLASGRRVALKALGHSLDSPEMRKRFLREGQLAASINHPNSVYVYGTEEVEGTPVITMELVPGGTLHERVKADGPMPVARAIDAILQVIAGLEAAHAVGILHRDIKPANCFIDPAGAVKVGDFGLSISTLPRGDSVLTLAGSVLGTPEFSSPEQLRGEALDLRSDIYSVGMTLYYLLTGKPAFQAENLVQLLATVLEKPAPSPRTIRPDIPEQLARVVLRCLAKQSGDRFKTYDELRAALLPFTATAPTPATLGLRLVAGIVDHVIFMVVSTLVAMLLFGGFTVMMDLATKRSPEWFWFECGTALVQIAYFAVGEGRWGATLGKALVGLRVGGLDRNAPGLARALVRALIYMVPGLMPLLLYPERGGSPVSLVWQLVVGSALWWYPALLAVTARRRNGFATVIDLLTKTRVIQKSDFESRESFAQIDEAVAATEAMPQIGPFHALATLSSDDRGELVLGYDTKLMRRVWIRKVGADAAPVAAELRNAARPGRLRWLQGHRNGVGSWDAYEAAPGMPLTSLLRTPQPWKNVRHWLLDLAEEFAAATRDGSMPAQLSLDRVWITATGRAKLLDFPAPGAACNAEPIAEPAIFLNQLAISALEGSIASPEEARTARPGVPLPLRARGIVRTLRGAIGLDAIAAELRALVQQRPAITRRRRLGLIAGCVVPSLIMGGFAILGMTTASTFFKKNPDVMRLKTALAMHERIQRGEVLRGVDPALGAQPLEIYIAGRFGHVVRDPGVWSSPNLTGVFWARERQSAGEIIARHGHPSEEAMAAARAALGPVIAADGELAVAPVVKKTQKAQQLAKWPMALGGFVWAAFASVLCAVVFRGGLLMRALGIAVVSRDGADASRGRMLWRACIAWAWLPLGALLVTMLAPVSSVNSAVWLIASIVAGGTAWSVASRGRSLPDRLAGTWLVPR